MFIGREFMPSLGLYDMRNRVYDPEMGRFYQTDPIGFAGDPTNLYRFCGHNPLLGGDPTGLQSSGSGDSGDSGITFFSSFFGSFFSSFSFDGSSGSDAFYNPLGLTGDSAIAFASEIPWGGINGWGTSNANGAVLGVTIGAALSQPHPPRVFNNFGNENTPGAIIVRETMAQLMMSPAAAQVLNTVAGQGNTSLAWASHPKRPPYNQTFTNPATNAATIYWDPNGYWKTSRGDLIPPKMILLHELYHRTQPRHWWDNWPVVPQMDGWAVGLTTLREAGALRFEQRVSDELVLPKRFSNWRGTWVRKP